MEIHSQQPVLFDDGRDRYYLDGVGGTPGGKTVLATLRADEEQFKRDRIALLRKKLAAQKERHQNILGRLKLREVETARIITFAAAASALKQSLSDCSGAVPLHAMPTLDIGEEVRLEGAAAVRNRNGILRDMTATGVLPLSPTPNVAHHQRAPTTRPNATTGAANGGGVPAALDEDDDPSRWEGVRPSDEINHVGRVPRVNTPHPTPTTNVDVRVSAFEVSSDATTVSGDDGNDDEDFLAPKRARAEAPAPPEAPVEPDEQVDDDPSPASVDVSPQPQENNKAPEAQPPKKSVAPKKAAAKKTAPPPKAPAKKAPAKRAGGKGGKQPTTQDIINMAGSPLPTAVRRLNIPDDPSIALDTPTPSAAPPAAPPAGKASKNKKNAKVPPAPNSTPPPKTASLDALLGSDSVVAIRSERQRIDEAAIASDSIIHDTSNTHSARRNVAKPRHIIPAGDDDTFVFNVPSSFVLEPTATRPTTPTPRVGKKSAPRPSASAVLEMPAMGPADDPFNLTGTNKVDGNQACREFVDSVLSQQQLFAEDIAVLPGGEVDLAPMSPTKEEKAPAAKSRKGAAAKKKGSKSASASASAARPASARHQQQPSAALPGGPTMLFD